VKRNLELKARLPELLQGHEISQSLGAELHCHERQLDTYFTVAQGRLKLRQRWSSHVTPTVTAAEPSITELPSQLIWYRRSNEAKARPSDYTLVEIPNGELLRESLSGALGVVVQVSKRRTVYLWKNVRIHLDQVDGLGTFLEFEAIIDQNCDEHSAQKKVERLVTAFRVTDESILDRSYADMLLAAEK
jgi:adenylate cyclase class IV